MSREFIVSDLEDMWLEYDRSSDILYINFGDDVEDIDEALLVGEDIVVRIKGGRLVSITINNFSKKAGIEL
ncbi:hypothetical protein ATG_00190 [Desulfurococcaceae archaeon AG1]|jgi:uncharacterized protein YuzE|nr:hypothetical protein ATG_00190 [Desulfurococcaceae archaeon AG1]